MLILRDLTSHSVVVPYRNRVHDRGLVNTQVASGIGTRKDLAKLSGLVLRQTDKGSNTFSLPRNTPLNVFMKKSVTQLGLKYSITFRPLGAPQHIWCIRIGQGILV